MKTVLYYFILFYLWLFGLCMCTTYVPAANRHQERKSDLLELELQWLSLFHVAAVHQTPVPC